MRLVTLLLISFLYVVAAYSQSLSFSQFYTLRTALNPAYISAISGVETTAGHHRQWGQVQDGFHTTFASVAIRSCNLPLAVGSYVSQIKDPFFGYRQQEAGIQVGGFLGNPKRGSLHGALQAGAGQQQVDYAQLLFSGQLDPLFGIVGGPAPYFQSDGSRVQIFEVGGGVVWRSRWKMAHNEWPYSFGGAIQHVSGSRDVSFLRLANTQPFRYTAHGSVTFPVSGAFTYKPVLYIVGLCRFEWESSLRRGTAGAIFQYDAVQFGLLYQSNRNPAALKNTNTLTLVLGGNLPLGRTATCTLQYSFDGVLSGLGQAATGGAHELTAIFSFPQACVLRGLGNPGPGPGRRGNTNCYQFAGKGYRGFFN